MMTPCFNNPDRAFKSHLGIQIRHLQHQSQHKTYTNLNMLTTSPTILDHQCSNICHQYPRTHYKSLHKHSPSPHQLLVLSQRTPLWTSPSMQQHIHCMALPTGNISTPTLLHTSITTPCERISLSQTPERVCPISA